MPLLGTPSKNWSEFFEKCGRGVRAVLAKLPKRQPRPPKPSSSDMDWIVTRRGKATQTVNGFENPVVITIEKNMLTGEERAWVNNVDSREPINVDYVKVRVFDSK